MAEVEEEIDREVARLFGLSEEEVVEADEVVNEEAAEVKREEGAKRRVLE